MNFIIVPVRNGLHLTRDAVKDFLSQDIGDVEVLVIDNASTDGTTQWLATQPVRTIYNNPPKSVAASWNQGLRWVFGQGCEYTLVVNNDVRLRPDTYRWLVEDGGGFVTAVGTIDPKKIERNDKYREYYKQPDPDAKRNHPDFSAYLIRREVYEKVGPFDEDFKGAYAEDSDYHLRMHQAGITAICLDLPFLHYGAQTITMADEEEARRISEQANRNRAYFKQKHGVEVGSAEYYALFGHGEPTDQTQ
jgi:GT2 family glycosyltransferase